MLFMELEYDIVDEKKNLEATSMMANGNGIKWNMCS